MADINSQLPVKLTDGTLTATVRDTGSSDSLNVSIVDGSGNQVTSFGSGTQYTEDAASAGGEALSLAGAVRRDTAASSGGTDGDYVTINTDATGKLWVNASGAAVPVTDNSGSLTVDNGGTFAVQATIAAGATSIAKAEDVASADADVGVPALAVRKATPVNTSGSDGDYEFLQMSAGRLWASATIDAAIPAGANAIGKLAANSGVDIGDVTINNTEAQAVPVYITGAVSGGEVNNYDTSSAVSAAATDNHDYTVTTAKNLILKSVVATSSGKMKVVVTKDPTGTPVILATFFTTSANPTYNYEFSQPVEIAGDLVVRVARTNLEASAMDVYSFVNGVEVA